MRYLHTMIRVNDLEKSLAFYCQILGLSEVNRIESEEGRFTLVYLAAPLDKYSATRVEAPTLELTYNWESEEYTGA